MKRFVTPWQRSMLSSCRPAAATPVLLKGELPLEEASLRRLEADPPLAPALPAPPLLLELL